MKTLPLIGRFLDYLDVERNFSAHTIRSYQADLTQYCRYLAAPQEPPGVETTAEDLPPAEDLQPGRSAGPSWPPSRSTSAAFSP